VFAIFMYVASALSSKLMRQV